MAKEVWSFPITGDVVSEVLRGAFGVDEVWLLLHMDVA